MAIWWSFCGLPPAEPGRSDQRPPRLGSDDPVIQLQTSAPPATRDSLETVFLPKNGDTPTSNRPSEAVEWLIDEGQIDYLDAIAFMDQRVALIAKDNAPECVWLLEHPPLYTAGTSANTADLVDPDRFPVYKAGRGGQYTYHGPGQRIAYVMLNLKKRSPDVRRYVAALESWLIGTLAALNIRGERREDRVGVWVARPERGAGREDKIAAIGVRVRQSVTLHGISLNVAPDLSHFSGIVPCGVSDHGVTSLEDLGHLISMPEVDVILRAEFEKRFGKTA